jgi:hypothetical protein
MPMKRRRQYHPDNKITYMNIVGIFIFQTIALGMLAFWYYVLCLNIMFDKPITVGDFVMLALMLGYQVILVFVWEERKQALKKIKEWQDAGIEVRYWDPTRRHYYPLPKKES